MMYKDGVHGQGLTVILSFVHILFLPLVFNFSSHRWLPRLRPPNLRLHITYPPTFVQATKELFFL